MKKGQGAMEYLMTYGWALLVIVIVGAALFALGILNPATYQQRRCNGFQYFTYMDQQLGMYNSTHSNYTLHVRNGVQNIAITGMKVGSTMNSTNLEINDADIRQGDEFIINQDDILGFAAGTNYDDLGVTVYYSVAGGIQNNTDTATCVVTAS